MLKLTNISKTYGKNRVVDGVNLDIQPGELCTLLGPSGCGKTTLLRMIAGLEQPEEGKIFIHGKEVTHQPPFQRDIGMVFQSYALFPHYTVRQNISYGLEVLKKSKKEISQAVEQVAGILGLQDLTERQVHQLSGGQQQRVALARALVMKPKVLLFDEPLSNLDAKLRRGIREEIRSIQKQFGITSIYVTHDQSEALAISDRIFLMKSGRIAQSGTPRELYDSPQNDFVARFIGEANLLDVTIASNGHGALRLRCKEVEWNWTPPQTKKGGRYHLLLRPEKISLSKEEKGFAGVIKKAVYLGWCMEYTLTSPLGELFVVDTTMATQPFAVGEKVFFDPAKANPVLISV